MFTIQFLLLFLRILNKTREVDDPRVGTLAQTVTLKPFWVIISFDSKTDTTRGRSEFGNRVIGNDSICRFSWSLCCHCLPQKLSLGSSNVHAARILIVCNQWVDASTLWGGSSWADNLWVCSQKIWWWGGWTQRKRQELVHRKKSVMIDIFWLTRTNGKTEPSCKVSVHFCSRLVL